MSEKWYVISWNNSHGIKVKLPAKESELAKYVEAFLAEGKEISIESE